MELLEQHFDTAFSAQEGIQKLRELILTQAMQGKLVPQDPNDTPASELLQDIEAEKKRLVKEGRIKAPKPLPAIANIDTPYELPQGWQWVHLGSVGHIFNGNSINAAEKESKYAGAEGLPYIATKDVGYGFDPLDYGNGICIPPSEVKFRVAHQGAVLVCSEGGSAGKKCGLTDRDICFGNKLFANELYGRIPSRFILYAYLSPIFRASFAAAMTGIIGGVSIAKFVEIPLPLPPLEEQHRIVARIDQLMARCDALEKLRDAQEKKRKAIHAAALSQLLDTTGDGSPDDAWAFITQNFGDLYAVKENVAKLRRVILQLAISGRLTESSGSSLASEPATKSTAMPFTIPSHWRWVPLQEVSDQSRGITYGIVKMEREPSSGGVFALRCSDVKYRELDLSSVRRVSTEISEQYSRTVLRGGELLLNIRGTLGGCVVVPKSIAGYNIAREIAMIPLNDNADADYILNVISSPYFTQTTNNNLRGIAYKGLNLGILSSFPVPLPPKDEQILIVKKVNHLLALCDTLDARIEASSIKKTELLCSVMTRAQETTCV
jgi:type I restriction enzyme S subunit